jgi:sensor domain CHASE-containing protein
MTTLSVEEITELAALIEIDPSVAIQAFEASANARAQSFRALREWQRANQEQAKIVSAILMQREGNLSERY